MEKLSKLLMRLLDRTERGLVSWQPTADDDAFQFSLPDSSVLIEEGNGRYFVSVLNSQGQVVDAASDGNLDDQVLGDHREIMKKLYGLARRKALKADETLDGILAELSD